jgi:hypothetical protein
MHFQMSEGDLVKITPDGKKDFTAHRLHGYGLVLTVLPYGKYEIYFSKLGKARHFYYCDITKIQMIPPEYLK